MSAISGLDLAMLARLDACAAQNGVKRTAGEADRTFVLRLLRALGLDSTRLAALPTFDLAHLAVRAQTPRNDSSTTRTAQWRTDTTTGDSDDGHQDEALAAREARLRRDSTRWAVGTANQEAVERDYDRRTKLAREMQAERAARAAAPPPPPPGHSADPEVRARERRQGRDADRWRTPGHRPGVQR